MSVGTTVRRASCKKHITIAVCRSTLAHDGTRMSAGADNIRHTCCDTGEYLRAAQYTTPQPQQCAERRGIRLCKPSLWSGQMEGAASSGPNTAVWSTFQAR